jgi:hypothetical protein
MTNFLIPLVNTPQKFNITLAGKDYTMICKWNNSDEGGWVADFIDAITTENVVSNVPLITGADCLAGLEYLGFNGKLFVLTDGNQFAVPTLTNLGVESNLYFQIEDT